MSGSNDVLRLGTLEYTAEIGRDRLRAKLGTSNVVKGMRDLCVLPVPRANLEPFRTVRSAY